MPAIAEWSLERYRPLLRLQARGLSLGAQFLRRFDESDIVQEAMIRAEGGRANFRGTSEGELVVWLQAVLESAFKDQARREQAGKRDIRRQQKLDAAIGESSVRLNQFLAADGESPSRAMQREEQIVVVAQAVSQLEPDQRDAILLREMEGLQVAEIAMHGPDGKISGRSLTEGSKAASRFACSIGGPVNAIASESERDDWLASVAARILKRIDAGEPVPSRSELARLYPELVEDLDGFLNDETRGLALINIEAAGELAENSTLSHGRFGANEPLSIDRPAANSIPGYELLAELDRGGMGVVYRARQLKAGRLVALKMIRAGVHASSIELGRFRTEAEAVARLAHPNVVQVFEVGENDGLPFFSMELCTGGSLAKQLAGNPMPPAEAATLMERVARAVQAAHTANVLHRDLKPANILLTADKTPKVTDFGLAKLLESDSELTRSGAILGTPSYMAPEQAAGDMKLVGPRADVYALGAVLYECLTGRPPFKGVNAADTLVQVKTQDPVPVRRLVPAVPLDLETVCHKCLEKEPGDRYPSADALAMDLERILRGELPEARPVGILERLIRAVKYNPAPGQIIFEPKAFLVDVAFVITVHTILFSLLWHRAPELLVWGVLLLTRVPINFLGRDPRTKNAFTRMARREMWTIWWAQGLAYLSAFVAARLATADYVDGFYRGYMVAFTLQGLLYFLLGNRFWGGHMLIGVTWLLSSVFVSLVQAWAPLVYAGIYATTMMLAAERIAGRRKPVLVGEPGDASASIRSSVSC